MSLFCFDLLHVDGRDLLDEPLSERIAVMAAVLPPELVVRRRVAGTVDDGRRRRSPLRSPTGFEGVVVKKLDAPYAAGGGTPAG